MLWILLKYISMLLGNFRNLSSIIEEEKPLIRIIIVITSNHKDEEYRCDDKRKEKDSQCFDLHLVLYGIRYRNSSLAEDTEG